MANDDTDLAHTGTRLVGWRASATFIFAVLALFITGCTPNIPVGTEDNDRDPAEPMRLLVVGIDRTESWKTMTRDALRVAQEVLRTAQPGDDLSFRWISDRSYEPSERVVDVVLPRLSHSKHAFDRRGKAAARHAGVELRAVWDQSRAHLAALTPEQQPFLANGTPSTDLYGFFAAAADRFAADTEGRHHILVVISDTEDNRAQSFKPDLRGVEVVIKLLVKPGTTPAIVRQASRRWQEFLVACGSNKVKVAVASAVPGT